MNNQGRAISHPTQIEQAGDQQGSHEEGIEQLRQGLAAHQATGTQIARPHFLGPLAEALGKTGQSEEGLSLMEEALQLLLLRDEACYLAELYRVRGELLLIQAADQELSQAAGVVVQTQAPHLAQAEDCFHKSIGIAKQQNAKAWELRTSISLAQLYKRQGTHQRARDLVRQVYDRFTEGFDTSDLRQAKALLAEL